MSAPSPALEALGKQNPDSLLSSTKGIWNELSSSRELLLGAETIKAMPNWTKTANVDRFIFLALEALGKKNPDSLLSSTKEIGNELSSSRELLLAETNKVIPNWAKKRQRGWFIFSTGLIFPLESLLAVTAASREKAFARKSAAAADVTEIRYLDRPFWDPVNVQRLLAPYQLPPAAQVIPATPPADKNAHQARTDLDIERLEETFCGVSRY